MLLSSIAVATRNVKEHDLESIIKSIERFGFNDAVIIDERTKRLVSGHGRLEALRAMQEAGKPAPLGVLAGALGWQVNVQRGWSSRDDTEAEAFLVAANRLVEKGGWDEENLANVLADLSKAGALEGIGWSSEEVDKLLSKPEIVNGATDALVEWQGMPDFRNAEGDPVRSIVVNFRTLEDVEKFSALIGQELRANERGLWFPKWERETPDGKEYIDAASD